MIKMSMIGFALRLGTEVLPIWTIFVKLMLATVKSVCNCEAIFS